MDILDQGKALCKSCVRQCMKRLVQMAPPTLVHGPQHNYRDIHGFGVNTIGDWVEGTTYPIVNESPLQLDMQARPSSSTSGGQAGGHQRHLDGIVLTCGVGMHLRGPTSTTMLVVLNPMALNHQLFATVENGTLRQKRVVPATSRSPTPDLLLFLASFGQPCAEQGDFTRPSNCPTTGMSASAHRVRR